MKMHKIGKTKNVIAPPKKEKERKSHANTLPSDLYKPLFDPIRLQANTFENYHGEEVTEYLEIAVKRFDDDLENAPKFYISTYRESPRYTGYLKGKTISFSIEALEEVIDALDALNEKLAEMEESEE